MRLSTRAILMAVILAVALGAQQRPIDRGIKKWQTTEADCGGLHTADCQCWQEDASDCDGDEICHWCPGVYVRPFKTDTETFSFWDITEVEPPTTVEFHDADNLVYLIDLKTGNVEIAKDLDMNEASGLFWKILQEAFPFPCEDEEPLHPKLSVCEKACPDGTTCGCVEPTIF